MNPFFKIINFIKNFFILNLINFNYKNFFKKKINTKNLTKKNYSKTKVIFYKNISFLINPNLKDFYENNLNTASYNHLFLIENPDFFTLKLIKLIKKNNKNLKLHCDFIHKENLKETFLDKDIFSYIPERKNILALKYTHIKIIFYKKNFFIKINDKIYINI